MPAVEGGKLSSDRRKISKEGVLLRIPDGLLRFLKGIGSSTVYF
jgi:hypothetical protein